MRSLGWVREGGEGRREEGGSKEGRREGGKRGGEKGREAGSTSRDYVNTHLCAYDEMSRSYFSTKCCVIMDP